MNPEDDRQTLYTQSREFDAKMLVVHMKMVMNQAKRVKGLVDDEATSENIREAVNKAAELLPGAMFHLHAVERWTIALDRLEREL